MHNNSIIGMGFLVFPGNFPEPLTPLLLLHPPTCCISMFLRWQNECTYIVYLPPSCDNNLSHVLAALYVSAYVVRTVYSIDFYTCAPRTSNHCDRAQSFPKRKYKCANCTHFNDKIIDFCRWKSNENWWKIGKIEGKLWEIWIFTLWNRSVPPTFL